MSSDDAKMVGILLNRGATINQACPSGKIPLFHAIDQRRCDVIAALCTGPPDTKPDMNALGPDGRSPLHYAVKLQLPDVVRELLVNGADPNTTCDGEPAIHFAIEEEHPPNFLGRRFVEHLMDVGADLDVNIKDKYGRTPLKLAVRGGKTHILEMLLKRKDIVVDLDGLPMKTLPVDIRKLLEAYFKRIEREGREIEGPQDEEWVTTRYPLNPSQVPLRPPSINSDKSSTKARKGWLPWGKR